MRAALWLMSLFAVAVATALLASNNVGTVSIFGRLIDLMSP